MFDYIKVDLRTFSFKEANHYNGFRSPFGINLMHKDMEWGYTIDSRSDLVILPKSKLMMQTLCIVLPCVVRMPYTYTSYPSPFCV